MRHLGGAPREQAIGARRRTQIRRLGLRRMNRTRQREPPRSQKDRLLPAHSATQSSEYPKISRRFFLHLRKALAAIYRFVLSGLERYSCRAAASCTGSIKILSCAFCSVFLCSSALFASLGLVLESFFSIELLLTGRKNKCVYRNLCKLIPYLRTFREILT